MNELTDTAEESDLELLFGKKLLGLGLKASQYIDVEAVRIWKSNVARLDVDFFSWHLHLERHRSQRKLEQ